jgi:zinc-ribbon domain
MVLGSDQYNGNKMMYNNKCVVAVKADGKILREFKDAIFVPFGTEYSLLVKNLNSVRAIFNIFIDGDNVVPGGLVLAAGQEIDLERSIKNGNLQEGNKFKFISRTSEIENHRGVKLEDGLIRIEYQFEKVYQRQDGIQWNNNWRNTPITFGNMPQGSIARGLNNTNIAGAAFDAGGSMQNLLMTATAAQSSNDVGITVPGSKSDQKFSTVSWFPTELEKHTIVLKILGETTDNKPIAAPVTVKSKPKCTSCGRLNKAGSKFCSSCGTALELF